jgi:hypothetical protein
VVGAVAVVLEGAAASVDSPGWVAVHRARRGTSGDDALVEVAEQLLADGHDVLAVSADRGLRARWARLSGPGGGRPPLTVGPRWLLDVLDGTTASVHGSASGSMHP